MIYTAGRPPWYDLSGNQEDDAFIIGLCGGSASGKTSVAKVIVEASGWFSNLTYGIFAKDFLKSIIIFRNDSRYEQWV